MATTINEWRPNATKVRQKSEWTLNALFVSGNKITVACSDKSMVLTIDTATTADILARLTAAINALTPTAGVIGTEVRSIGGQEIPEFNDFIATNDGATILWLDSVVGGLDFTVTISTDSVSGTLTKSSPDPQIATGPNDVGNAINWSAGALAANHLPVIKDTNEGLLQNIEQNYIFDGLEVWKTFGGSLGRPYWNPGQKGIRYKEYRPRFFWAEINELSGTVWRVILGRGPNTLSAKPTGVLCLDFRNQDVNLTVEDDRLANTATGEYPIQLKTTGGQAANVHFEAFIKKGKVDFVDCFLAHVKVDWLNTPDTDCDVVFRKACVWDVLPALQSMFEQTAGVSHHYAHLVDIVCQLTGGVANIEEGNQEGWQVDTSGVLNWKTTGTLDNDIQVRDGGLLDFTQNDQLRGDMTGSKIILHAGSSLDDSRGTLPTDGTKPTIEMPNSEPGLMPKFKHKRNVTFTLTDLP